MKVIFPLTLACGLIAGAFLNQYLNQSGTEVMVPKPSTKLVEVQRNHLQVSSVKNQKDSEVIAALQNAVDHLEEQVNELAFQRQEDSAEADRHAIENEDMRVEEKIVQQYEYYASYLSDEAIDEGWAIEAERQVVDALSSAVDLIETRSVECRASLCRLNIGRLPNTTDEAVLDAFDMNIQWPGEMSLTYDPNTGEGTVYLARVGMGLPQVGQ